MPPNNTEPATSFIEKIKVNKLAILMPVIFGSLAVYGSQGSKKPKVLWFIGGAALGLVTGISLDQFAKNEAALRK